jgi:drug/metabolite transporter (DMT)-like permease
MTNSRQPTSLALVVGFAALYISWGTTYLPTRIAMHDEHMPPLSFGGIRILCAGLVLLFYQFVRGGKIRLSPRDVGTTLSSGGLLFVTGAGLMNAASQTINSSLCAVLAATTPLWLGLLAMLWPHGERLTPRGWLGLVVGMGGVIVLVAPSVSSREELVKNIGVLFIMGSAISWALGSLILRHTRLATPHLTTAAYQMIFGGAGLIVAGLVFGEAGRWPEHISARAMQAFFYLLVVGSLVGFVAFNWLLHHVAAAKVGTYAYVNPMIAVLVGWAAGEEMTGWLGLGIGVILLGVFLVRGGERPATVSQAEAGDDHVAEADWQMAQMSEPS